MNGVKQYCTLKVGDLLLGIEVGEIQVDNSRSSSLEFGSSSRKGCGDRGRLGKVNPGVGDPDSYVGKRSQRPDGRHGLWS